MIANVKVFCKLGRANIFNAYSGYSVVFSVSKSTKEVFCLQGAWHSKNTLPTIFHGQVFRIIIEKTPPSSNRGLVEQLCWYGRHELPQLLFFPPRIWHSSWRTRTPTTVSFSASHMTLIVKINIKGGVIYFLHLNKTQIFLFILHIYLHFLSNSLFII